MKNKQQKKTQKKGKKAQKQATVSAVGQALRSLGGIGGGLAGGMFGRPVAGQSVGTGLGAALSKWLGFGDYSVSRNTLVEKASTGIPMMHKNGQSVVIRHKEFIATISGSTDFTVQQEFTINPGLDKTFPWLSAIASRFSEYEIKGMVYHYIPTSGTFNGVTSALGALMIQTSYRATDIAPSSKAEMLNEYWAGETVPYETLAHPIECDPKENPFAVHYVRTNVVDGSEPLLYDLGKTFVATQGMIDDSVIGDLWVSYEIELKKPVVSSNAAVISASSSFYYTSPTAVNLFNGVQIKLVGTCNLSFSVNTITVPKRAAKYIVTLRVDAATTFATPTGTSGWGNPVALTGSGLSLFSFGTTANIGNPITSTSGGSVPSLFYQFGIQTTGANVCTVAVPGWQSTGIAALVNLLVIELPN